MRSESNERTRLMAGREDDTSTKRSSTTCFGWTNSPNDDEAELSPTRSQTLLHMPIIVVLLSILGLMAGAYYAGVSHHRERARFSTISSEPNTADTIKSTNSKYTQVQGIGFQIYTGGAPVQMKAPNGTTIRNPECRTSIGQVVTDTEPELQCYLGVSGDAMEDARRRLEIMKRAVWQAHDAATKDPEVLKVFVAPEFFWRGADGAYIFAEEAPDDSSICGPICFILEELEDFVANEHFEDWVFLFGTIIASEVLPKEDAFDYLFYNFAPVYKGYNPDKASPKGKRFLLPKRFVSSSDFLTPQRNLDLSVIVELLGQSAMKQLQKQDTTVSNPFDSQQKRYDDHIWRRYKNEQESLKGYAMIEYDWLMIDGLAFSMEICFDHQMHTAQNTYLGDLVTGRRTLIPSSTDDGLEYVSMPLYQAQISVVSSAGMTIVPESMALADHGVIFLQDGLSNATNRKYWSNEGCELGFQFDGGTEAVQRRTLLSPTDVSFYYDTLAPPTKTALNNWEDSIQGMFSTKLYPAELVMFEPVAIAETP